MSPMQCALMLENGELEAFVDGRLQQKRPGHNGPWVTITDLRQLDQSGPILRVIPKVSPYKRAAQIIRERFKSGQRGLVVLIKSDVGNELYEIHMKHHLPDEFLVDSTIFRRKDHGAFITITVAPIIQDLDEMDEAGS